MDIVLKSSILIVQKLVLHQNGVKFRQQFNGAIRTSLTTTPCGVAQKFFTQAQTQPGSHAYSLYSEVALAKKKCTKFTTDLKTTKLLNIKQFEGGGKIKYLTYRANCYASGDFITASRPEHILFKSLCNAFECLGVHFDHETSKVHVQLIKLILANLYT